MKDEKKTKAKLIQELRDLRRQQDELTAFKRKVQEEFKEKDVRNKGKALSESHIDMAQERLARHKEQASKSEDPLLIEAFEALSDSLEELGVSYEELRQQNEEIQATRESLESERRRYQDLFEFAPDGYLVTTPKGIIKEANRAAAVLLGVPQDYLQGKTLRVYIKDRSDFDTLLNRFQKKEKKAVEEWEGFLIPRKRKICYARIIIAPIENHQGKLIGLRWLIRDITLRKQAQEALLEQFRFLQQLLNTMPIPVFYKDNQGVYRGCNEAFENIVGLTKEQVVGKTVYEVFPHDLADIYYQADRELFRQSGIQIYETSVQHADGTRHDIIFNKATYVGANGQVAGLIGAILDITKRKRAEEEQQRTANQIRLLLESTGEGIIGVDSEGRCIFINKAGAENLGYLPEEFQGQDIHQFIHHSHDNGSDYPKEECPMYFTLRKGGMFHGDDDVLWRKDGTCFWVEYSSYPIMEGGAVNGAVIVFRDITERKRIEEQVRSLGHRLLKTQEDEKRRLSRELHDVIGQNLLALKMAIDSLFKPLSKRFPEFKPKGVELSNLIQQTVEDVRDMAHLLRPSSLEQLGLVKASLQYSEEFSAVTNIEVDFSAVGISESHLDYDTKITLYRLIQESLNNIKKHAGASRVIIRIVSSFPNIILRIEDNGQGFDVKSSMDLAVKERHLGLISMEERVSMLQGQMKIESQPGKGTKILIEVPSQGDSLWPTKKRS